MKRLGNLYERIISLDNLRLADKRARKGKRDNYGVRAFDKHREENLLALHDALVSGTFKTSPYFIFSIHKPKERIIYRLPYYPDRILHHAVMNVMEKEWVKTFPYNTFSCIRGRGIHGCKRRVDKIIRSFEGRPLYCLKIDISKFYPSVDHDVLKRIIRRRIKDKRLLALLDEVIDSASGIPIGNYLSQYFANLVLCYFLHWVNEVLKVKATQYADDIVFFSDSKERLHEVLREVRAYLRDELHLHIKGNWQVFPVASNKYDKCGRALDYVGYQFFREQTLLRKGMKKNLCRTVARLNNRDVSDKEYKQRISAWLGWAKHSDSRHLLKTILKQDIYESTIK